MRKRIRLAPSAFRPQATWASTHAAHPGPPRGPPPAGALFPEIPGEQVPLVPLSETRFELGPVFA